MSQGSTGDHSDLRDATAHDLLIEAHLSFGMSLQNSNEMKHMKHNHENQLLKCCAMRSSGLDHISSGHHSILWVFRLGR